MRQLTLFAAMAAMLSIIAFSAQAMPAASFKSAVKSSDQVIQVRDGCGRHKHRGPHGHCRWDR
jgi:hypothetical protein